MRTLHYVHVFNCDILEDLAVVDVPHCLVIPDFRGKQDCSENNSTPVARNDLNLCVGQQALEIDLSEAQRYQVNF